MHNALHKIIIATLVVLSLTTCGDNETMRRLKVADLIMEDNPSGALDTIMTIDRATLDDDEEKAYYALLNTQAGIKTNERFTDDSIIIDAYRYYRHDLDNDLGLRAIFYRAKIMYNAGNYPVALKDALRAYDISKELKAPLWIARTAQLLYDIYNNVYNYPAAQKYNLESIENFGLAGRPDLQHYATADIVMLYLNRNENEKALATADSLLKLYEKEECTNQHLIKYTKANYYAVLSAVDNLTESQKNDFIENAPLYRDQDFLYTKIDNARFLQKIGKYDEAVRILENLRKDVTTDEQLTHLYYAMFVTHLDGGNYKKAAFITDTLLNLQEQMHESLIFNYVGDAQSEYFSEKAALSDANNADLRRNIVWVIILSLLLILIMGLSYRLKLRSKTIELEKAFLEIAQMRQFSENIGSENKVLQHELSSERMTKQEMSTRLKQEMSANKFNRSIITNLFQNQWRTFNLLCDEYFEKGNNEKIRISILKKIEREIASQKNERNLRNIEKEVNAVLDGIMLSYDRQFPETGPIDRKIVLLSFAGLSNRAICIFTDLSYKTFLNRKSSIKKTIRESDATDKELFLTLL